MVVAHLRHSFHREKEAKIKAEAQAKAAARGAAERLVRRRVSGQMGYLKNRPDGSASLAIITSGKLLKLGKYVTCYCIYCVTYRFVLT